MIVHPGGARGEGYQGKENDIAKRRRVPTLEEKQRTKCREGEARRQLGRARNQTAEVAGDQALGAA